MASVSAPSAIVTPPLVWAELVTARLDVAAGFYGAVLGWRTSQDPGKSDLVVHLDQARVAGPICGLRPRTLADPLPDGADPTGEVPDRWTVRLAPPRPPRAADPSGDQLLRPRSPGPRIGRWAAPSSLCFAELRTHDVEGARLWLERRLDAILVPASGHEVGASGIAPLLMQSSVDPGQVVACVVDEPDAARIGWIPCVQVASVSTAVDAARGAGARSVTERPVPAGCVGARAAEVVDPGGAVFVLVESGPAYSRR